MSDVSAKRLINPPDSAPFPEFSSGTLLVDASDPANPKIIDDAQGYYFFGADAPLPYPGLSKQWLTEIVAGKSQEDADTALIQAIRYTMANNPFNPRLRLSLDYNCTEYGLGARIVRRDFKPDSLEQVWNYLVVDAADTAFDTVMAYEIWLSNSAVLTPDLLHGRYTLGRKIRIDAAVLKARIANP